MVKSKHFLIRKTHRWLGFLLGIQFLLWTIGGLYFSWSNIDEIHGDFQKKNVPLLSSAIVLVSPTAILEKIKRMHQIDSVVAIAHHPLLFHPHFGRTGESREHIFALCSVNDSEDDGGLSIVVCSAGLEHEIKVDLGGAFFVCAHIYAV